MTVRFRGAMLWPVGTALVVAGAGGVVLGAALPWLRTGSARRSAFGVARAARNLGLADAPLRRAALALLFTAPMLAGLVLLLVSLGRRRAAAVAGMVIGVVGLVGGLAGSRLPGNHEYGQIVSGFAGVVSILGSLMLARSDGRPRASPSPRSDP